MNDFLLKQAEARAENKKFNDLAIEYKKKVPIISLLWDMSEKSIFYNDINNDLIGCGIDIYTAEINDIWDGIFKPEIYAPKTLWKNTHDKCKIAKVIHCWEKRQKLSPIFLVKHLSLQKALIADGNHRFTVAKYIKSLNDEKHENIPFMVSSLNNEWIKGAIPSASLVQTFR